MEVKKSGGQANSEGKKIGSLEGKLFTLKSLSSNPPTFLSSTNHPSPQPSPIGDLPKDTGMQINIVDNSVIKFSFLMITNKNIYARVISKR